MLIQSLFLSLAFPFTAEINSLGSPVFTDRVEAHRRLHAIGVLAWPAVTIGCQSTDPEIRWRCEQLARPIPCWLEVTAVCHLFHSDWCSARSGEWWAKGKRHYTLDLVAHRAGLIPAQHTGPWYRDHCTADNARAYINWCRAQWAVVPPWPWARSWADCLDPEKISSK